MFSSKINNNRLVATSLQICIILVVMYLARETGMEIEYRFPFKELIDVPLSSLASAIYYSSVGAENTVVFNL